MEANIGWCIIGKKRFVYISLIFVCVFFSESLWYSQALNVQWNMIRSSEGNQLYIGCTFCAINRIKIRLLSFKCHFDLSSCHKLRHILQFDGNENETGHVKHSTLGNMPRKKSFASVVVHSLGIIRFINKLFFLLRIDFNQLTCSKHGLSNKNTCSSGSRGFFNK